MLRISKFAVVMMVLHSVSADAEWHTKDSVHPTTEKRSGYAVTYSENRIRALNKMKKVSLRANCYSSGEVNVVVYWGYFLKTIDSEPLEVILDTVNTISFATIPSRNGEAQIIRNTEKMMTLLWSEQTFLLRSVDLKGIPTEVAQIDTAGFRSAWAESCGWHYKYDAEKGYVDRT